MAFIIISGTIFVAFLLWAIHSIYDHFADRDNAIPLLVKLVFFGLALAFFGFLTHAFLWQYTHPKEVAAQQARQQAAIREANSPHLIYQKDGCDVFRFRDGINHYFVRCPNARTTAIGQHEVTTTTGVGKMRHTETHVEQEEITTEDR